MRDVRVVLIGGTSNVGKSTVAGAVAERLGFECLTTDGLARHPGRPWRTPERQVPAHVAEHYRSLTVDELITSVLGHYDRLWPRIEELITAHATEGRSSTGLVLEGSALWPVRVAGLRVPEDGVALRLNTISLRTRQKAGRCVALLDISPRRPSTGQRGPPEPRTHPTWPGDHDNCLYEPGTGVAWW